MKRAGFCATLLTLLAVFTVSAKAANVGYYEMCDGQGDPNQVASITAAGHTPVDIVDLSPAELAGIALLMVNNCSNGSYSAEYLGALTDIEAAVSAGLRLMIHDRYVDIAETILPGGGSFNIVRNFDDDSDIDVVTSGTALTNGPGGTVDNSTLDGGNSSSHGFALLGSLGGALPMLSTSDPSEIVSFAYPFGAGGVYYSSIPLDHYLGGGTAFATVYAANAVAFGMSGAIRGTAAAVEPEVVPVTGPLGLVVMSLLLLLLGGRRLRGA